MVSSTVKPSPRTLKCVVLPVCECVVHDGYYFLGNKYSEVIASGKEKTPDDTGYSSYVVFISRDGPLSGVPEIDGDPGRYQAGKRRCVNAWSHGEERDSGA
ncbi:hypothetical protein BgiBS90_003060 [Biomphalaria glabrata]|nr:hypothetical protein BgiBS90_003060 [Biomphalaria glabrata]